MTAPIAFSKERTKYNERQISFNINASFKRLYTEHARYKDLWGGRGRGGSHTGTDYFLYNITRPQYFRGYMMRQTLSDVRTSLFQGIKDRINDNPTLSIEDFRINENNMTVKYIPTGNLILSKGVAKDGSRTAAMKSLEGATHVLIEEADEVGESDFDQMDLSLRTLKADDIEIIRIFNPPQKAHWIWRDYILEDYTVDVFGVPYTFCKARPKADVDLISMFATYHDNIMNIHPSTQAKFEEFKDKNPEYYWSVIQGLITDGARGRIYSGWRYITEDVWWKLPYPVIYGLDFGYSQDPNALIAIKYDGLDRYCHELIYEKGLDNVSLAKRLRDCGVSSQDLIIADFGSGGNLRIAELRRGWQGIEGYRDLSFNITATTKGNDSINFGIGRVKSCNNYITETSKNLSYELREYKWALDANKNPTDRPIDFFNHLLDGRRYVEQMKGVLF